jgi:MIT (microtubule interacting and transport) domain
VEPTSPLLNIIEMPTTNATEERQPLSYQHQAKNTSSSSLSSSIVTVHRAAPIGPSRSDPRPSTLSRAQISSNTQNGVANFSRPVTPPESRRPPSAHSRSNSVSGVRDGVGNLNRWSQSTTSSKGSAAHRRSSSLSRRMSFGGPGPFVIGAPKAQTANKLHKPRPPVGESPLGQIHPPKLSVAPLTSTTSLPTLITAPAFQKRSNDLSSPLTAATSTPLTASVLSAAVRATVPDYFSKVWEDSIPQDITKLKPPIKDRISIDPLQPSRPSILKSEPVNGPPKHQRQRVETNLEVGHSKNRSQVNKSSSNATSPDKGRDRTSKQPSQKAMLSKALQKANTAVLLDNAQNFEGAMEAYSEACNLLQQVMVRSSGDEDKRKLEAIVGGLQRTLWTFCLPRLISVAEYVR